MTPKIPSRDEPSPDDASIKSVGMSSANADTGKEKLQLCNIIEVQDIKSCKEQT